tara:strand:- start:1506 stop:2195 length:690 start_codon:yes stop_codon:yes gene_type:complete
MARTLSFHFPVRKDLEILRGGDWEQVFLVQDTDEVAIDLEPASHEISFEAGFSDAYEYTDSYGGYERPWSSYGVAAIDITSGGAGYSSAPTLTIADPPDNPDTDIGYLNNEGITATATTAITAGVLTSVIVTNRGKGYTSVPTVSLSGSGGAVIEARVSSAHPFSVHLYDQTVAATKGKFGVRLTAGQIALNTITSGPYDVFTLVRQRELGVWSSVKRKCLVYGTVDFI